jgi:hypothetical protein
VKQSKIMSLVESFANIAIGYAIQCVAFAAFLPLFGFRPSLSDTMLFGLIMTVVSVVRSYFLRRLFEALHIRDPLSPFMLAVAAERRRQIEVEGWTPEHDDAHRVGEMADAGAAYAHRANLHFNHPAFGTERKAAEAYCPNLWPWDMAWWKPVGFRRDLVKAAALIAAEGEKFDRSKTKRSAS